MRRKRLLLCSLILLCLSTPAHAQLWSGILDPSRATDWTQAGVTIVKFSGGYDCRAGNISAYSGLICAGGSSGVFGGDVGTVTNIHNWTANYAQGTTQLVLDSTSGLVAGTVIVMDQCDETTD